MATDVLALRTAPYLRRGLRWRLTEPQVWFIGMFGIYFGAACYLALVANIIYGDAFARVELAQRILFSRDPHLAAIGFVWNPLPVLALLPVVPLKLLWPQLVTLGLAGGLVSAICMAGATVQVRGMIVELGVGRPFVALLTAAFGFHPLIFYFGANGMSEAMMLLFLLIATRYLARWLRDFDLNSLTATGFALSLAYLTRYEALAAAGGVVIVVAVTSLLRTQKRGGHVSTVICDAAIVGAPVALAFVVFALASWLITGEPFQQLTGIYDNRTKVPTGYLPWSANLVHLIITQLASLEPLLLLLLIMRLITIPRRHLSLALASAACLGATLTFKAVAELNLSITNELRYFILAVPLAVAIAGAGIAVSTRIQVRNRLKERAIALACTLSVIGALPVSARAMLDSVVNPYASAYVQSLFSVGDSRGGSLNWTTEREVAADLDRLKLPPGTVLMDDYIGFPIVVTSNNPKQFVITSDRDFQSILADPSGTGVRYILVPMPIVLGKLDAVNRQYPSLFDNGAGFATLVREYQQRGMNDTNWRLYRIN